MSIINDALNKARQERDKKIQQQEAIQLPPPAKNSGQEEGQAPAQEEKKISTGLKGRRPLMFSLIGAAVVLIAAISLITTRKKPPEPVYIPPQPEAVTEQVSEALTVTPAQPASGKKENFSSGASGLALTGIVYAEGSPMAVINGSVYMEGDNIGSAVVLKISEDRVVLEEGGKKIELTVR